MHYEGMMIRPPSEANSILLQVTLGCSHNKCTFCGTFREKRFDIKKEDIIFEDIEFARKYCKRQNRVFICDGDAMIVPQKRLVRILEQIRDRLPWVELFHANHASNYLPIRAKLPEEKEKTLELISRALKGDVELKSEFMRAL